TWTVGFLADWLRGCSLEGFSVRVEQPLTLIDSEPEPDIAVVEGSLDDYRESHPVSADMVIEVAVSTEDVDREKTSIYAGAGISEYWIVLPQQQIVVVHRNPSGSVFEEQTEADLNGTLNWQGDTLSLADLFKK
ncbi:MAG: Uma2 family endonuclease, partial [Fuerstiella sp.]|nr:Uma2 family endonuclease [Fuerstiella sp.]